MNARICPTCHLPIPPTAPGGFCPACVLRDADEPPPSGRPVPSMAELAAAFPQFEILSLVGQGGMGSVFKVRQPKLDRVVALKILCPELGRDPAFAERFAREARVLAKLNQGLPRHGGLPVPPRPMSCLNVAPWVTMRIRNISMQSRNASVPACQIG